ncbi:PQQ-dependent sugar dehydrogenase [Microbacterium sp. zg.Y625]|uniref:PQQ-dependent sugar dehydrogenase n=1 Tax=Microbacterium jiangjiandongii TaxID=3049071 RepID=UPI00214B24BA|nr:MULTISPECIES: PQQ-dependent sugar dehydrogenase [unclassified Microbacterium]MCR2793002.1 PQQ-dependent sugar dehydrogenase [Microbacterium sp. zg.Y625]WIM24117.1 PQQ-dependent sugar dehydrogenase [Microbacterium sp. zg-Y625]
MSPSSRLAHTRRFLRVIITLAVIALLGPHALTNPATAAIDVESIAIAADSVYRAVNLNGAALSVDGVPFESGLTAPNVESGPSRFCNQNVALDPVAAASTAAMIRCSVWGKGSPGARVTMTAIPNGSYKVSLYTWEDNASQTFSLGINGATVATNVVSGAAGTWKVLGPYAVDIANGTLAISSSGGAANLSGLVLERAAVGGNRAPAVTAPGNQTSARGAAIAPLTIAATDPDTGQTLQFSATGLPAGLGIAPSTGIISGTPTAVGTSNVTVRATDNGSPALTGSAAFSWTINDTGTGTGTLYRAVNLNGPALTVGDVPFEAGTSATNLATGPSRFCNQNVTLIPATDASTAAMIRCSVWGTGSPGARVTMSAVPNGTYRVSLYTWEDNASATFSLAVNGATAASNIASGPAGSWKRLGPYETTVTNGTLAVTSSGGAANISGVVVERVSTAANAAPTVTGPGTQTSTRGVAIAPLPIRAVDPDPGQSLTYAADGLPAGLTIAASTGVITGTPTALGTSNVTVRATDSGSPRMSGAASFTWSIGDAATAGILYRAVNLNGPVLTADGIDFEAGTTAANLTSGPSRFCNQDVNLIPATDESKAAMLRCSIYGSGSPGARLTMSGVPAGTYDVSAYTWEDNASATYSLVLNGRTVADVVSGPAGTWKLLGPYPVTVTSAGTIALNSVGGTANISGITVRATGTTKVSTVSVTSPAPGATLVEPATLTGSASATAGVDRVLVAVRDSSRGLWWNGAAWQAAKVDNAVTLARRGSVTTDWSYAFNSAGAMGPYELTATAVSTDAVASAPSSRTFSAVPSGSPTFDPAKVADTFVAGGNWTRALAADWLGNGHMVVLSQLGYVYDVDPATGAQRQILDLTGQTNSQGEAGALDILTDPAGTGFYVYYTVANSDRLRISHFTAGSRTEQVIWTNPGLGYNTDNPYHVGASLNIGPDSKLYVSIGDRVEGRSQDRTNVFGKVLRLNLDGTIPADNPLRDGAGPNLDEIWAYGFRNPYRTSFDRTTGRYWIADVGGNVSAQAYEEVNIGQAGANYGWPGCEGPGSQPKNGPICPGGVTVPVYSYAHTTGLGCCQNKAIIGGEIYRGSMFPLAGYYVYADYPTDQFYWLQLGADGRTGVASGLLHQSSTPTPVWLSTGPDGAIYWLSLGFDGTGELRKLSYAGSNDRPPVISSASATPTSGAEPLTVRFSGAAGDPDGTAVTYRWDFGDGTSATTAAATHTYAAAGSFQARLQVTSNGATTSSDPIFITVGAPPKAAITSPPDGTQFSAGQTMTFTGSGTDPGVGALPGSALSWNIEFLHDDHAHPAASGTGASITYKVPTSGHDFSGNTRYRVTLTVRDADGLIGTSTITVWPRKTKVQVTSNAASTITVDEVTQNLPFDIDSVLNFQHTISVPATVCQTGTTRQFSSWSDGGARTHTITVTANLSLVATYTDTKVACTTPPAVGPLSSPSPSPSPSPAPTATPSPPPSPSP